jgi:nicotinamide-nucleotide amidase
MMEIIKAEILAIGDELLYGQTLDTNSHFISEQLDKVGIKVVRRTTVGDYEPDILKAFSEAEERAHIVLITGGLGPTSDDLTKPCLAKYFNCETKIHAEALEEVTAFFKQRGRELTELNKLQAALPVCCEKITNTMGTAPGMWFERHGKIFMSMPGVPHEMKNMVTTQVIPKLLAKYKVPIIRHQIIRTAGIGESFLAEKIGAWERELPAHMKLAYLPSEAGVKLRLTAIGVDEHQIQEDFDLLIEKIKPYAGEFIFAFDDNPLEVVTARLLREKKLTLSIAESCTGGYVSHLITSVPGSSDYFKGGIVSYDNAIKIRELDVQTSTLEKYGAVSEEAISEMAKQARKKFNTSIALATSGIAGPDGGTPEKPVGTVWIAYADEKKLVTRKLQLSRDRLVNIKLTGTAVLNLLYKNLSGS